MKQSYQNSKVRSNNEMKHESIKIPTSVNEFTNHKDKIKAKLFILLGEALQNAENEKKIRILQKENESLKERIQNIEILKEEILSLKQQLDNKDKLLSQYTKMKATNIFTFVIFICRSSSSLIIDEF
jgi:cell shape-determining protein MreC